MANNVNYVRFLRGTPRAFDNVVVKDPDTLYFISEVDATSGDLYLGSKLIAGKDALVHIKLGDLTDVVTNAAADNGSLLVFDEDQGKWVVKSPAEVSQIICSIMEGATHTTDGKVGLVPAPKAGQEDLYLRGNGTWSDPTAGLRSTLSTLIADDGGLSIRQIAVDVLETALIPDNAKESLDTLHEIADWIQSHPDSASDFNTRIKKLENSVFDVIDEDTGTVIHTGLETTVGDLSSAFAALNSKVSGLEGDVLNIEGDITNIYERLKWHEMDENPQS